MLQGLQGKTKTCCGSLKEHPRPLSTGMIPADMASLHFPKDGIIPGRAAEDTEDTAYFNRCATPPGISCLSLISYSTMLPNRPCLAHVRDCCPRRFIRLLRYLQRLFTNTRCFTARNCQRICGWRLQKFEPATHLLKPNLLP